MQIPSSYTSSKFFQYCGKAVRNNRYLNGSCPICREGKSWGKKKRLYYFPQDDYLYCQNCSGSWTPAFWIKEVTGMSWKELKSDVEEYTGEQIEYLDLNKGQDIMSYDMPVLPPECVNVTDVNQLKFYIDNWVVKKGLAYIKSRRLDTARFSPKSYYICLNDKYYKNRLIIPYYDQSGRIDSYIGRTFLAKDERLKYLLKFNSPKHIFNLNLINPEFPWVFPIEGPIDCMFVQNGAGISGTSLTEKQENDLNNIHPLHKKIWIFDNYRFEGDVVRNKIADKLKEGETVFMYGDDFEQYKDMNAYCVAKNLDQVDTGLIIKHSYTGQKGLLML
jgi:hypothetical protein